MPSSSMLSSFISLYIPMFYLLLFWLLLMWSGGFKKLMLDPRLDFLSLLSVTLYCMNFWGIIRNYICFLNYSSLALLFILIIVGLFSVSLVDRFASDKSYRLFLTPESLNLGEHGSFLSLSRLSLRLIELKELVLLSYDILKFNFTKFYIILNKHSILF